MSKYLDLDGLKYNITKTKEYVDSTVNGTENLLIDTFNFGCAHHLVLGTDVGSTEKTFTNQNSTYKGANVYSFSGTNDYVGSLDTIKITLNGTHLLKDHTYTLSFYIKGSPIGSYSLALSTNDGSNLTNELISRVAGQSISNDWQFMEYTFTPTGDTTDNHSIYLVADDSIKFAMVNYYFTSFMLTESKSGRTWSKSLKDTDKDMTYLIERAPQMGYPLVTTTAKTIAATPNTYYRNTSTVSTLKITLAAGTNYYNKNYMKEYFIEFTTGSSGCTLTVPTSVKWANGEVPTLEASKTYQLSIVNNLAIIAKFE